MSTIHLNLKGFSWITIICLFTTFTVDGKTVLLKYQEIKNTSLKAILVDGDSIDNFVQDQNTFIVDLPYSTVKSPSINAIPVRIGDIVRIFAAGNVLGSERERTARILVSSKDKTVTETYKLIFKVLPKLDLFLFIGQSNMAGRGTLSSEYLDTLNNVFLLTPHAGMEPAMNPLNKYSNIRKALKMQQIGPGYEFSKKIVSVTGVPIGLVVNARGGSSINSWVKGSNDKYYEMTMVRMKAALKWGTLKAILWHQGESDSKQPEIYMKKLSNMVENFRNDLGNPKLFFEAGELAYWRKESALFNAMIRTISTSIPNSAWVSAEGLTPLINISDPHFDASSQLILGERYAEKVLEACYGK